ncbi:MAG TPA: PilT/PilU family type 4a pilus ATPase, partial [Polyangiaceae bacterium]|nr:PilT/PilU family type 4a pilus ATPase [Polyangiaceae bacterium]
MKTLQELLRELTRSDVIEFAVASDRLPCIRVGDKYEPVDNTARSTPAILEMLVKAGGSRHVDDLAARPAQWSTRIEGVGMVAIQAAMRGGRVQARFTLARRTSLPPLATAARRSRPPSGPRNALQPMLPSRPSAQQGVDDVPLQKPVEPPRPVEPLATSVQSSRAAAERMRSVDVRHAVAMAKPSIAGRAPPGFLDALLATAREAGASDLHVVAGRPMLIRFAGDLTQRGPPLEEAAVEEVLVAAVPDRLWPTLQEQGSCDFALERPSRGRFRVNVSRQRTGYKGCFRCIPPGVPTLASLGLPPEIERATHHHQGLVLVTGPTGHGKTSTLAAVVDIINRETTHHIITVEDPVEFVHPRKKAMISQREVGSHTRSFASALKASLREDPDVIVVGELRDTETVRMALAASETGHLVLGTMNTPSAAKTIDRLVDLFPPGDQPQVRMTLAGGLHLIIGQRLLPTADAQGMVVAAELLPGSIALWNLIRDAKTYQIPSLQQRGKGFGILRMDESLADLVKSGKVTREAALAVAENPDDLES